MWLAFIYIEIPAQLLADFSRNCETQANTLLINLVAHLGISKQLEQTSNDVLFHANASVLDAYFQIFLNFRIVVRVLPVEVEAMITHACVTASMGLVGEDVLNTV